MLLDNSTKDSTKSRAIFKRTYGNQTNFMTPTVIEFGMSSPNLAWELSKGEGLSAGSVNFGVTVLEQIWGKPTNRRSDLSTSFPTEEQARQYIKNLSRSIK